jgi:hypothetical protein
VRTDTDRALAVARVMRSCHGLLALLIAVGIVIQLVLLANGGADANSTQDPNDLAFGVRVVRLFSYFTIESNLLVMAASFTLALRPGRDGRLWRVLQLDALLGIIITGLVYDIVLARQVHLTGMALALTIVFHYIAPWGAVLLWLLFGPRPRIDWRSIAAAFVWPVAWIVYTFVHGAISGWWPYPFLDADEKGYPTALVNTALVVVIALVIALVLRYADRLRTLGGRRSE